MPFLHRGDFAWCLFLLAHCICKESYAEGICSPQHFGFGIADATGQLAFLHTSLIATAMIKKIKSLLYVCIDFRSAFQMISRDAVMAAMQVAGLPNHVVISLRTRLTRKCAICMMKFWHTSAECLRVMRAPPLSLLGGGYCAPSCQNGSSS